MYAVDVAIQTLWTANSGSGQPLVGITGGLAADLQPPTTSLPYAVMSCMGGSNLDRGFRVGGKSTVDEPIRQQFSVFGSTVSGARGRAVTEQYAEAVASVFDDATLTLAGGATFLSMLRQMPIIISTTMPDLSSGGIQIWQAVLIYEIRVQPAP